MEGDGGRPVLERTPLLILDASVAVKWFARERLRKKALEVRQDYFEDRIDLLAPPLIRYEIGNALRFHPGSNSKSVTDAIRAIADMQIDQSELSLETVETASRIAFDEKITFYDAAYLSLAETHDTKLLTDDRRLYEKVGARRNLMQLLENYSSASPNRNDA